MLKDEKWLEKQTTRPLPLVLIWPLGCQIYLFNHTMRMKWHYLSTYRFFWYEETIQILGQDIWRRAFCWNAISIHISPSFWALISPYTLTCTLTITNFLQFLRYAVFSSCLCKLWCRLSSSDKIIPEDQDERLIPLRCLPLLIKWLLPLSYSWSPIQTTPSYIYLYCKYPQYT